MVAAMNGERRIDGRTRLGRELRRRRDDLALCLGSDCWEALSRQKKMLVRRTIFKDLICESIENYAVEHGPVKGGGALLESLDKNYLAFANSLRLDLQAFGLERLPRDVTPTLDEIRRRYERADEDGAGESGGDE